MTVSCHKKLCKNIPCFSKYRIVLILLQTIPTFNELKETYFGNIVRKGENATSKYFLRITTEFPAPLETKLGIQTTFKKSFVNAWKVDLV